MSSQSYVAHRILLHVGIVVVFLSMLGMGLGMGAIPKLLPVGNAATDPRIMFPEAYGLPVWFVTVTGVLELLAAVLVVLPRLRSWGAMLTGGIMAGAVVVNFRAGFYEFIVVNLVILAAAVLVVWYSPRALWPFKPSATDTL